MQSLKRYLLVIGVFLVGCSVYGSWSFVSAQSDVARDVILGTVSVEVFQSSKSAYFSSALIDLSMYAVLMVVGVSMVLFWFRERIKINFPTIRSSHRSLDWLNLCAARLGIVFLALTVSVGYILLIVSFPSTSFSHSSSIGYDQITRANQYLSWTVYPQLQASLETPLVWMLTAFFVVTVGFMSFAFWQWNKNAEKLIAAKSITQRS